MLPTDRLPATAPAVPAAFALRGDLLDFTGPPAWGELQPPALRWRPGHWLWVDAAGRIEAVAPEPPRHGRARVDRAGCLVLPGFVDTHVHSAQLDVIASYGTALLDWLETYTFPSEALHADAAHARPAATLFCDALLAHGTTAAVVFPTVHAASVDALFEAAGAHGMRMVAGKVLMDRHAPEGLRDDVEAAERDCRALIARWHGRGRSAYAVTVRFAPTSTPAQLAMAGRLCREDATLYAQTHVAENEDEVRWVRTLFPEARSYLEVYERVGLLHPRSVLAHGIWLDDEDRRLLAARGAQLAHCPTSNLFLGSGLFDWRAAQAAGVPVSVASDVGGGTSLALPRNLAAAYQVQALRGERLSAWSALHAATRGAAEALRLGHEIGSFDTGCLADLCVWDWAQGAVAGRRQAVARELHERVFAWLVLADERALAEVYVAGRLRHVRAADGPAAPPVTAPTANSNSARPR